MSTKNGVGMFMWRQLFRWGTIAGLWMLEVLKCHALRNGLQRSGRKSILKKHEKKGFNQVLEWPDGVLGVSKIKFYFEQSKVDQRLANEHAGQIFEKVPHNSEAKMSKDQIYHQFYAGMRRVRPVTEFKHDPSIRIY